MTTTTFEFPLKEKVRNYLRIEHLLGQLKTGASTHNTALQVYFFEQLFTLMDLLERLDLRSDLLKDLDAHEKNLVLWSSYPNIDKQALDQTLQSIVALRGNIKAERKFGTALREDLFLSAIRQRFSIPGGVCSFDLPNLHYWLSSSAQSQQQDMARWRKSLVSLEDAVAILLSFLREKSAFDTVEAENGFYQGVADDKNELIRVKCDTSEGFYPTLSGNKYRYSIRFMWFEASSGQSPSVEKPVTFTLAAC
ncbi:cell division protein ZapD [Alteromonas sp. C1M14]|uniref:cell division protein ZapD n=1 Tax=Alteromonas sp. C1M14 TaxID=2841567 RepID=UPI001C09766D|nr:cell division protein ZapD [Alteromonas sp. C1M14]MBU2979402.1 cell division protein ZapD [Alteromonas sp. C1M14]